MSGQALPQQLQRLHDLILRERECVKTIDLDGLEEVSREKEELVRGLEVTPAANLELRDLAEKIQRENRRNAYLFWSSLKFIRSSISFFNRQDGQPVYGASGRMIEKGGTGLVLAGRA